jgi:uracil-DNA glycosylase
MPLQKPPECFSCPLENIGQGFSTPDGLGTSGVVIIGETLGHDEMIEGKPFRPRAQSGSKLDECIKIAGEELGIPLTRNHFLLWNVVACNPPGDRLSGTSYEHAAIRHCEKNFVKVIGNVATNNNEGKLHASQLSDKVKSTNNNVKVFLALGNIPLRTLSGISGVASDKQSISHLRGYPLHSPKYSIPVIGGYHPAFIKRGNGYFTPTLVEDIKKAYKISQGIITDYPSNVGYKKPTYIENPSLDDAWSYYNRIRDNVRLPLAYDIETPHSASTDEDTRDEELKMLMGNDVEEEKQITQIQFSVGKREGIALPWKDEYVSVARAIFDLENNKFGFNCWSFDDPRLKAQGINIRNIGHDVMVMFAKWHPNLERALQKVASLFNFPFPWKHLFGSKLQFYGCADVASVIWIIEQLIPLMKNRGVWNHYMEQVYGLKPILDFASDTGIAVNEEKRIELKGVLEKRKEQYLNELQVEVPDELKNLEPKRVDKETGIVEYGFKRIPNEVKQAEGEYNNLKEIVLGTGRIAVSFRRFVKRKYGIVLRTFQELGPNGTNLEVTRWCRQIDFNPSSKQLIGYLKWKRKQLENSDNKDEQELSEYYEIPISLKTGNETTGKKEIQELFEKTGDSVLDKSLRIRSLTTNITNYIPNWKPDADGRVHTEWGFLQPQEQLATRSPNIQNCSKHTEIGQEFRRIIEAPDGYTFVELDKKSFHVATMGYCANDSTYIRFSQLDPHSIFTSYIHPDFKSNPVKFSDSDVDILAYCKEIKKYAKDMRQDTAKPCVLGNQLGLGPHKLWLQNKKAIGSKAEAARLQGVLAELFPKVEQFKKWCRETANNQNYLMTDWGNIQYFYDVYHFIFNKKRLEWIRQQGDDAEKCLALMVQSTAFGMIKDELIQCWNLGYCHKYNFINTIHDSLMWMPKISLVDECIENISKIMNSPCKRLVNDATGPQGLIVKVECSVGTNWQNYDERNNPGGMKEI